MSDTKNTQAEPAQPNDERHPSEAQLAAVVEAAYILEAVRR